MQVQIFNVFGVVLFVIYFYVMIFKPRYLVIYSISIMTLSDGIGFIENEIFLKLLVLFSLVINLAKYGISKIFLKEIQLVVSFVFINVLLHNSNFDVLTQIKSAFTFIIGFLLLLKKWTEDEIIFFLKLLSFAPLINVLLGVVKYSSLFNTVGRIASVSYTAYLVIYACVGFFATVSLFLKTKKTVWLIFALINTIISLGTMQRMGNVLLILMLIEFIWNYRKSISKKAVVVFFAALPFFVMVFYKFGISFIERTFSSSYLESSAINTSGRTYLWGMMWPERIGYELFGHGFGFINTLHYAYWSEDGVMAAHNEFLRFILETGYFGLLFIFIIFVSLLRKTIKRYSKINYDAKNNIFYLIYIFIPMFGLLCITDNMISNGTFFYLCMILFGMISGWSDLCAVNCFKKKAIVLVDEEKDRGLLNV